MTAIFDAGGNWYKGVTHIHSTRSDGGWTPEYVVDWYKAHGYDFLSLTDHLVCTDIGHLSTPDFLTIPGVEIHGYDKGIDRTPHVVGLGSGMRGHVEEGTSLQEIIDRVNANDMLAIIAHPYWSSLRDEHLSSVKGYVGIEVYNHTCWEQVGKGDSLTYWDNLLRMGRPVWGLAVDDAHCPPSFIDAGGGWIMVKAQALTEAAILSAIRSGHFYASQGPTIYEWHVSGKEAYVRCSPVERIVVHAVNGHGGIVRAPHGETITEASFTLRRVPRYLRATCVDTQHRRAWTNPVFSPESTP